MRLGIIALALVALGSGSGLAQPAQTAPPPIRDNSFLIEEAHNQEGGVVQHISVLLRDRGGSFTAAFTQEWPLGSQRHQFSVTLPFERLTGSPGASGVGDVLLNYRFQALSIERSAVALAPRFSLVLPSGSERKGFGSGRPGFEINLPVSLEPFPRLALHVNVGGAWTPDRFSRGFIGASAIYLMTPNANIMAEVIRSVDRIDGQSSAETTFLPGVRFALNHSSGLQVVPGVGVPIRVSGPSRGRVGLFFYLSFEHPF